MKRAVITGLGALTPIGNNVNDYWKNLINGKSGAAPITRFDATLFKTKFACEVKNFDPLQHLKRSEIRKMDLYTQFAVAAADECLHDSGLDLNKCNRNKIGVIIASGVGGASTYEEEVLRFGEGGQTPQFSPYLALKLITNMASGQLSIRYDLHGPSYSIVSACASSNNAIANALDLIRLGRADAVIAGGAEATTTRAAIGSYNSMRALSVSNDSPETASRPFDKNRDGFVIGEGAGVLMIEELENAIKRGARIYCELAGYGTASDGYHITATHPEGLGAQLSMKGALADAGILQQDVDYINANATSTQIGDIKECLAIEKVFNGALSKINISATKSMTGHLLGAAGAIEAIASIKSIENNIIPPTINLKETDPEINSKLNLTPNKAVEKEISVALSNTFGFGGHTSSVVFKRFDN